MTLEELCKKYGVSESSVKDNFNRTKNSIMKKYGISIIKEGRGKNATYREEVKETLSDKRALTMYNETHSEIIFNNESLTLVNAEFLVFLGIVSTPMAMFRGAPADFLRYIGIKATPQNLEMLDDALLELADRELIFYETDEDIIILYVRRKVEKEMKLGIEMIRRCREIAEKNNKHKDAWLKLLKVWIGVQICAEDQPFTIARLSEMTGLSQKQILECRKLLEHDNLFITSRAGKFLSCTGKLVTLNGFYNS